MELLRPLQDCKLLTKTEAHICLQSRDPGYLISILPGKSTRAFEMFYEVLKTEQNHIGHKELADLIKTGLGE